MQFVHKASYSLSATYAISQSVKIPVIASSGINLISASLVVFYVMLGVCIGKALRDCPTYRKKLIYIREVINSMPGSKILSPLYCLSSIQNLNNFVV